VGTWLKVKPSRLQSAERQNQYRVIRRGAIASNIAKRLRLSLAILHIRFVVRRNINK